MYFELLGSPVEAEQLYAKELEADPSNPYILKRMVALKRGQGDAAGAAEALKTYLATQVGGQRGGRQREGMACRPARRPTLRCAAKLPSAWVPRPGLHVAAAAAQRRSSAAPPACLPMLPRCAPCVCAGHGLVCLGGGGRPLPPAAGAPCVRVGGGVPCVYAGQ